MSNNPLQSIFFNTFQYGKYFQMLLHLDTVIIQLLLFFKSLMQNQVKLQHDKKV